LIYHNKFGGELPLELNISIVVSVKIYESSGQKSILYTGITPPFEPPRIKQYGNYPETSKVATPQPNRRFASLVTSQPYNPALNPAITVSAEYPVEVTYYNSKIDIDSYAVAGLLSAPNMK